MVSVPLGKAAQIFSYCTFASLLPLAVSLPYYNIQVLDFYSDVFEVQI
jgi:hypothetical protein